MNDLCQSDMKYIVERSDIKFDKLLGKTILITGATGLIGRNLVLSLLAANEKLIEPITVLAVVRNINKAKTIFGEQKNIKYVVGDVTNQIKVKEKVDFIIHAASQTSSKAFVDEPVETILTAFVGTQNMLELARCKLVKGFVYLSTMEVYGSPLNNDKITEEQGTNINVMKVRSCYPESKRMCESLCASYASEYGVPIKVVRLTQTFGPGVDYNDGRVFAEFARAVIENRNIILKTKGETKRNYLYTEDAVDAILTVMLDGAIGEAYNAANEDTYCSIYDMACLVASKCADGRISVEIQEYGDVEKIGYAPTLKMNLDTRKLRSLGWKPKVNLEEMFDRMIEYMKSISR